MRYCIRVRDGQTPVPLHYFDGPTLTINYGRPTGADEDGTWVAQDIFQCFYAALVADGTYELLEEAE